MICCHFSSFPFRIWVRVHREKTAVSRKPCSRQGFGKCPSCSMPAYWRDNVFQTVFDIFLWKGCVSLAMLLGKRQCALLKGCLPGNAPWRGEASISLGAKEPRAQEHWSWSRAHSWDPDPWSCSPASPVACGKHPGGKSDLKIVKNPRTLWKHTCLHVWNTCIYLQDDDIEEAEPFPGRVWFPAML